MRRALALLCAAAPAAALAAPVSTAPVSTAPVSTAPISPALGRLALVERQVELTGPRGPWARALEGSDLRPGESLRTGAEGVVRVELPWMALTLTPASRLRFPDTLVLHAALDGGRTVLEGERNETLKLVTSEAEVRGRGRAVVRRERGSTLVTCLSGRFLVSGRRGALTLAAGQGAVVSASGSPTSARVPQPPSGALWPGGDPVYVTPGEPIELRWPAQGGPFQVELLPLGSEVVLLQRDVAAPPARVVIPWPGAFRWRVSRRDGRGLEGLPSRDGLIAVER